MTPLLLALALASPPGDAGAGGAPPYADAARAAAGGSSSSSSPPSPAPSSAPPGAGDEVIPPARLVYVPGRFAGVCPTEVEVQEGVTRRLGRSPFSEPAERVIVLALEGDAHAARQHHANGDAVEGADGDGDRGGDRGGGDGGVGDGRATDGDRGGVGETPARARTEMFDAEMTSLGARTLESSDGCRDLVEAAELAISIALAPGLALAPPPELPKPIEPRGDPPPAPAAAPDTTPAAAPSDRSNAGAHAWLPEGARLMLGIGLNASLLLGPESAAGANVSAALRFDQLEVRLERREHVPGLDTLLPAGPVLHGAGVYTLAGCGHLPLFALVGDGDRTELSACATASAGSVWGIGNITNVGPYVGGSPYAGAGGRVAAGWSGKDLTSLRLWTQVEANLVEPQFAVLNGTPPWKQDAPVNVTFGVTYEIPY